MPTVDLTADTFEAQVTAPGITLVDFWAPWCGPCRQFAPVYEQVSTENPEIVFAKVNTENERVLAASASISSIPTLMAFRDGILVFRQPGALPASALKELVAAVEALDMEAVRAEVAKATSGA